jgi:putative YphP/YqiW family bacilliredoxin
MFNKPQQYPEALIAPMRQDLVRFGVQEARTAADVDALIAPGRGTVMMITNSVCGCAAGRARPAVGMAMQHGVRPAKAASVFAGGDEAAVAHLRAIMAEYPISSPSLLCFGWKPVFVLPAGD